MIWVGGTQEGQSLGDIYAYKQVSIFSSDAEIAKIAGQEVIFVETTNLRPTSRAPLKGPPPDVDASYHVAHAQEEAIDHLKPAPLVRIDPGLLVRNDPPLSGAVFGDGGCRREKEASLLEVSALVSA